MNFGTGIKSHRYESHPGILETLPEFCNSSLKILTFFNNDSCLMNEDNRSAVNTNKGILYVIKNKI